MTYYYAHTDENGVLCVDQMESDNPNELQSSVLAESYPEYIYFEYTKPIVMRYYAMEVDDLGVVCVTPQWNDEDRVAHVADKNPDVIFFGVEA